MQVNLDQLMHASPCATSRHRVRHWLLNAFVVPVGLCAGLMCSSSSDVGNPCSAAEVGGGWCAVAIVQLRVPAGGPPRSLKVQAAEVNVAASGVVDGPFGSTDANGNVQLVFRFLSQPTLYRDSAQMRLFALDLTRLSNTVVDSTRAFVHYFPVGGAFVTDTVRWTLASAP